MKLSFISIGTAAVLAFAAAGLTSHLNAQTGQLAIMGSSAQYSEAAQADFLAKGCFYIDNGKDDNIVDNRGTGTSQVNVTDHAAFWLAWTPSGGSCNTINSSTVYDFYLNADSVLGTRCFFASPACKVTLVAPSGGFVCGSTPPNTVCTPPSPTLTSAISNIPVNVASTDIRPEDGKFATLRALTPCGTPIGTAPDGGTSQYYGIGDQTSQVNQGNTVLGAVWTVGGANLNTVLGGNGTNAGSFNVANFNISGNDPASGSVIANGTGNGWVVLSVGAAPELVIVSPKNANGLGSLAVTNINRNTLAGFLDGTFGAVSDIFPQGFNNAEVPTNVILREYLSGTYNTMEYSVPNSVESKTSQEEGVAAAIANGGTAANPGAATQSAGPNPFLGPFPLWNCATGPAGVSGLTYGGTSNTVAPYNPLQEQDQHANLSTASTRSRAIGTGNVVKAVENVQDGLGYAFWSESNFASATPANLKYLTVDGVDPIQEVWSDGEVPAPGNGLEGNVSFSHVKDGSYPIWSILRMVTSTSTSNCNLVGGVPTSGGTACNTLLNTLVTNEQKFITPDFPDFVLKDQLSVVRSHFAPPGVTFPGNGGSACNGDAGNAEAGGDVGGFVYSQQADNDVSSDTGNGCGVLNQRQ